MSGSRWVITPSLLSGSWRSFLYSSSVHSCHLFLICSASVRSIPFLSLIVPIFAWKVPLVSNFLEEISRLSYSIVFLYFFSLISEEGFLISPCYSLELCIQMGISFLFSFAFHFSFHSFSQAQYLLNTRCISFINKNSLSVTTNIFTLNSNFFWCQYSVPIFSWFVLPHISFISCFCFVFLFNVSYFFLSYPWPMKSTLFLIACIKQWSTLELGS